MTTERRPSALLSEFPRTLLALFPIRGIFDQTLFGFAGVPPTGPVGDIIISATNTPRLRLLSWRRHS